MDRKLHQLREPAHGPWKEYFLWAFSGAYFPFTYFWIRALGAGKEKRGGVKKEKKEKRRTRAPRGERPLPPL